MPMRKRNLEMWMRFSKGQICEIWFSSLGILFDFVHFVKWSYLWFFWFFSWLILFALLQRNPCLSHIVPRIHLSLFNFVRRLSAAAPRVTCHPDLVVYHWCHRTTAARRIQALQCVSFLREEGFRGRFAKRMDVALVTLDGHYISFFTSSGLNVSLEVGILNYEFLIDYGHRLEKPTRLCANVIHLSMNYL